MKKALLFLVLAVWSARSAEVIRPPLRIQTINNAVGGIPATVKVPNGTLTVNTDGSFTLSPGGSGGSFTNATFVGGSASGLTNSDLTASRAVVSGATKILASSVTTTTELAYLSGATGNVQTNLNQRLSSNGGGGTNLTTTGFTVTGVLTNSSTSGLIWEATAPSYQVTVVATRDVYFNATSATVLWHDGSTGTYTVTAHNATFPSLVDSYTVTHATSGKTVTQSAVTRDSNGNISSKPALTVAP